LDKLLERKKKSENGIPPQRACPCFSLEAPKPVKGHQSALQNGKKKKHFL